MESVSHGFPPGCPGQAVWVVMAKAPVPGYVKTRLCPPLRPAAAAALHTAFLTDTLAKVAVVPDARTVLFSPSQDVTEPQAEELFKRLGHPVVVQRSTGLAKGLPEATSRGFEAGYGRVVLLGSDSPMVPAAYLVEAGRLLETHEVVVGPCDDGGYYLIGLNQPHLALFEGVPWSTSQVVGATLAIARTQGLKTAVLPLWYDVDTPDDLKRLVADIAVRPQEAPVTARFLAAQGWSPGGPL